MTEDIDSGPRNITLEAKLTQQSKERGLILPSYSREGDAGLDLRSVEELVIKSKERALVATGVQIAIPPGFVGLIRDRSGLAARFGIHTMAGVVDSNYRGEVKVVLLNTGDRDYPININDRIAQLIILPVAKVKIKKTESLSETNREDAGWGSSGKK